MISKNSIPIFFLLDLAQELNFAKRYTKQKERNWREKNKEKIKRYLLLKCKTIKTLLFEQEETNQRGRAKPLHAS
jgi:hypothetical protein